MLFTIPPVEFSLFLIPRILFIYFLNALFKENLISACFFFTDAVFSLISPRIIVGF